MSPTNKTSQMEESPMLQTSSSDSEWNYEDIFKSLGDFGRYQKFVFYLSASSWMIVANQIVVWVFIGFVPDYECVQDGNSSVANWLAKDFVASISGTGDSNNTKSYSLEMAHSDFLVDSAVREWSLVCDRENIRASISAAPMVNTKYK